MISIEGRRTALLAHSIVFGTAALLLSAQQAPVAVAQTPGGGLASGYSANAGKPVNIEADFLEVDDKKKMAWFKGNVSATQGDFNIRAKEIEVTYTDSKSAGGEKAQAVKAAESALPGNGSIKQIYATGKVLVTGKDNQTATSDAAIFEVEKQLVTLTGEVVVSQGGNMIKGDRLVIDITSGRTRFENEPGDVDKPKKRPTLVFTPKEKEKDKDKEKDKAR